MKKPKKMDEYAELLVALKYALEWMGRKPSGQYERHSFILAQGSVRNAIQRIEPFGKKVGSL